MTQIKIATHFPTFCKFVTRQNPPGYIQNGSWSYFFLQLHTYNYYDTILEHDHVLSAILALYLNKVKKSY